MSTILHKLSLYSKLLNQVVKSPQKYVNLVYEWPFSVQKTEPHYYQIDSGISERVSSAE